MLGSILLSHEVVPNFSGVASRRTVFELVLKIYREWQIIGICWNCQQIQDFQRYSRSNFDFQELNQNKILYGGPLLLSVTIMEPVITDQSKCCLRTQGMWYSKAFVQALVVSLFIGSKLIARKPSLNVNLSQPGQERNSRIQERTQGKRSSSTLSLHKLERTKTWSLWSTSSPLSRSILTVSYCPLIAALCRGPLDA